MFEALYSLASDAIVLFDGQGRILRVNPVAEQAFGYGSEELAGRPLSLLLPSGARRNRHATDRLSRLDGPEESSGRFFPAEARRKDGARLQVELAIASGELDGQPLRAAIFRDFSTRLLAEQQRDLAQQVMQNMGQGLTVTGPDARFEYVNPAYAAMVGCTPGDLIGKTPFDVTFPEDHPVQEQARSRRRRGEITTYETRLRRVDGSEVFVLITGVPRLPGGKFIGSISVITDLTDRRRMETALRLNEETVRGLYEISSSQEPFDIKVQALLELGRHRFGMETGQLASIQEETCTLQAVEPPDGPLQAGKVLDLTRTYCLETLRLDRPLGIPDCNQGEWAGHPARAALGLGSYLGVPVMADGRVYGCLNFSSRLARSRPFDEPDYDFMHLMSQWIGTEIERLEAAHRLRTSAAEIESKNRDLSEARDRALESSYLKSAFLATMSHEIRTPINTIVGMQELLAETALDADQRDFTRAIGEAASSLLTMINDILDFSKIEAGKLVLRPAWFDLRALAGRVADRFRPAAEAKGLRFSLAVSPDLPESILGDETRIRQVLASLVSNAVKFTEQGRVEVELNASLLSSGSLVVTFQVRDSGIGIDEAVRPRLFEPFTQADETLTRKHGGTGLGLAISRRLVEMMHGEIGFESGPGGGSAFWFSLPLGWKPSQPSVTGSLASSGVAPLAEVPRTPIFHGQKPVLVVEDNPTNRKMLLRQLEKLGLEGQGASTGGEALQALTESPDRFSLILMDMVLPDMDGLHVTRQIRLAERASGRRAILIAVTAGASAGDREACLEAGLDDYLPKPVSMQSLAERLKRWLVPG